MNASMQTSVKHRVDMTLVEVSALPRMNGWRALVKDKNGDQSVIRTANITPDGTGSTRLCNPDTLAPIEGSPINPPIIAGESYWSLEKGVKFFGDDYADRDEVIGKDSLPNLQPFVKLGSWNAPFHRRVILQHLNQTAGANFSVEDIRGVMLSEVEEGDMLVVADLSAYSGFVEYYAGTAYTKGDGDKKALALEPLMILRSGNGVGYRNKFARTHDNTHAAWATILERKDHRQWFIVTPKIYETPGGDDPTDHLVNVPKAVARNNEQAISELTESLHELATDEGWCDDFDKAMQGLDLEARPEETIDWTITAEAVGRWTDDSPSSGLDEFLSDEDGDEVTIVTRSVEYTGVVEFKFTISAAHGDLDDLLSEDFLRSELPVEFDHIDEISVTEKEPSDN